MQQARSFLCQTMSRSPGMSPQLFRSGLSIYVEALSYPPGMADKADFPPAGYFGGNLAVEFCLACPTIGGHPKGLG